MDGTAVGTPAMNETYDPAAVEADWYSVWEAAGVFRPSTTRMASLSAW